MASEVRVQELYVLMHVGKNGERLSSTPPAYTRAKASMVQRNILASLAQSGPGPGRKNNYPPYITKFVRVDQKLAAKLRLVNLLMEMWNGTHEFSIVPARNDVASRVPDLVAAIKEVRDAQG